MILHLVVIDKFIPPFIKFVEDHYEDFRERHVFFVTRNNKTYPVEQKENVIFSSGLSKYVNLAKLFFRAEKVIIHGLWDRKVIRFLVFHPWLLKKCYWVIWGGDLYVYRQNKDSFAKEFFRRFVIRRIGNLVTQVDGDVELARKWYGARGVHHECFMYTSNLYKEHDLYSGHKNRESNQAVINIQVGNSADPSNEHLEIFEKLAPFKDENIRIYAPLSYGGNKRYISDVVDRGNKLFSSKFMALMEFMPHDEYLHLLSSIDIAIFNHKRQQAMGNMINLLGMGKKVFMRSDISSWKAFGKYGITVFDIDKFDMAPIAAETANSNILNVKHYFSEDALVNQLSQIFNG